MTSASARPTLAAIAIAIAAMSAPGLALGEGKTETKTASRAPAATPKRATSTAVAASRSWHSAPPGKTAPASASGLPLLVLQGLNIPDRVELTGV